MDDIAGKGLSWGLIGELLFWMALTTIPMALPLSTLLASIMTMGNLGENNELLALKSAGISLQRIMRPLMVLVVVISILAFYISNNLLPLSNLKLDTLLRDVKAKNPTFALEVGVFTNNLPGYSIKIGDKNSKTNLLEDVTIYDHKSPGGNMTVTIADSGYISLTQNGSYLITLYSGNVYQEERNKDGLLTEDRPFTHQEFDRQEFLVEAEQWSRTDEEQNKGKMQMLSLVDLTRSLDTLKEQQEIESSRATAYYISFASFSNASELDTTKHIVEQHVKPVNIDSLYATYSDQQKHTAISHAVSKAEGSLQQMEFMKGEREAKRREIAQGEVEWHMKFTLSVACLIFFFIGAPLGAIIRKGGLGMPMVVSLFLFIVYWVIFSTGKKMAIQGSWNAAFAMWLPTIVLLPLGVFLTYKATTDSSLFNADRYLAWFKNLFGQRGNLFLPRINLKEIEPVKPVSTEIIINNLTALNTLCRQFERDYKLYQRRFSASDKDEWTMLNGQDRLADISYKYKWVINQLSAIDNEEVKELIEEYPLYNINKYQLHDIVMYMGGGRYGNSYTALYPIRKELKAIFDEIVRANDLVINLLEKNE
jgi:lipopolysaccharide export system permease protein